MIRAVVYFFSLVLLGTACSKENNSCLKASGKRSSEIRPLPPNISSILLEDNINLFISQDSTNEVRIEAGENLIDFIETSYSNGELRLTNNNKCNFLRSYKKDINVYLSINHFDSLAASGSGDITMIDTFNAPKLKFILSETTGDMDLSVNCSEHLRIDTHQAVSRVKAKGDVRYSILYNSGNGWFEMEELKSYYLKINSRSTGDCIVGECNTMFVLLQSSGNIFYRGEPQEIQMWDNSGDGKLIHSN